MTMHLFQRSCTLLAVVPLCGALHAQDPAQSAPHGSQFDDVTTANPELTATKDGALHAVLFNASEFTAVASLKVNGQLVSARFRSGSRSPLPAAPQQHGAGDGHQL